MFLRRCVDGSGVVDNNNNNHNHDIRITSMSTVTGIRQRMHNLLILGGGSRGFIYLLNALIRLGSPDRAHFLKSPISKVIMLLMSAMNTKTATPECNA